MKKWLLIAPLIIITILTVLWNVRPEPEQLETLQFKSTGNTPSGLTIQFLGNTNILLDDGETRILTDGFFTRPNAATILLGKVNPDNERIEACLKKAGITKLDAVIPVHSHFDHAMDAPVVAQLTGAKLIGSASTINIGKGLHLKAEQMMEAPLNEYITIGKFQVMFIVSKHWQYPDEAQRKKLLDQPIAVPLSPPASIFDYKEGISYTLLIKHDTTTIAIQGSAGFKERSIPSFEADVLFLAIAGIEVMDDDYKQQYQTHVVDALNPKVIVPIHWDDFTVPLEDGLKTTNVLFNLKYGSDLGKAFQLVEANNPNKPIVVLPLWERIAASELIEAGK